jgi:hypothetical protein
MEPEGSLPNLQVPANCPYLLKSYFIKVSPHKLVSILLLLSVGN